MKTVYLNAKPYLTPISGCILILRKALNVRKGTGSGALPTMHLFGPSITDRLWDRSLTLLTVQLIIILVYILREMAESFLISCCSYVLHMFSHTQSKLAASGPLSQWGPAWMSGRTISVYRG